MHIASNTMKKIKMVLMGARAVTVLRKIKIE
jgi:hypothetical protein